MVYIIIALIVALIVVIAVGYNGLISSRNNVKKAWSEIDVQLQRRFDLIPNLVETVKGYTNHEEKVLTDITELRNAWTGANSVSEKGKLNNKLNDNLKSVFAIAENYPDLKASTNFIQLQEELSNTENKIMSSRNAYNEAVNTYNTQIDVIPTNIVALLFKFNKEDLFTVDNEEAKKNVKVSF
jgi:LemA protein